MSPIIVKRLVSAEVNSAGQPVAFPQANGHVDAAIYEIPPGAVLPLHKHPFPRLGYFLAGTLQVTNVQTNDVAVYVTGDFALESVDKWHRAENVGTDPVRLLVIDLTEAGADNTVLGVSEEAPSTPPLLQSRGQAT